jgi:nucleoside 2-deoxyribosyltransferase
MPSSKRHLFEYALLKLAAYTGPNCPLCGTGNGEFGRTQRDGQILFQGWCNACTNVWITAEAVDKVRQQKRAHLLAAYLRRLPGKDWSEEVGGTIGSEDLEALTNSVSDLTVLEQFDLTLKLICEMCPAVGSASSFNFVTDWPLVVAQSEQAALFMLWELGRAGYLEFDGNAAPVPPKPTWKAYERLQQIQSSGRSSDVGFAAMSFAPKQLSVWKQVIEPGVLEAGYRPVRIDQVPHNQRIDDEIIAQIRRCRFLVADFTGQRNGVYFEAGFALGLGRNVIWMCNHSEVNDLHFDTRQFNHILYDDLAKARTDLVNRIVALEGPGNYIDHQPKPS